MNTSRTFVCSAKSGPWSAPATWAGGKVPGAGDRVLIKEGHRVQYDVKSSDVIRGVNVAGSLVFATDADTLLNVGLIKVQAGEKYSEDGFDCDHAGPAGHDRPKPELIVGTPGSAGRTAPTTPTATISAASAKTGSISTARDSIRPRGDRH